MIDVYNGYPMTGIAAALCKAMGTELPAQAEEANEAIGDLVGRMTRTGRVDRIFMYNPDAVGLWLFQKYARDFAPVQAHTQLAVPLMTVMPSVTPVCFGTMYTGALPEVHGIRSYVKPVIRIDTVFDAMIRSGKKCAVVSDTTASLSHIFLERDMDYFIYPSVEEISAQALRLIREDRHDLILVYHGDYDAAMHRTGPESPDSLSALRRNIAAFDRFAHAIRENRNGHETLIGFAPDHGCHGIDGGCGSHGLDMPEDLNVMHFYGIL